MTHALVSFAVVAALVTVVPALGTAMVLRSTISLFVSFRQGLLTNLLNPKVGAFYVATLPQFLPGGEPPAVAGTPMALVHDVEGMLWCTALILGARSLGRLLERPATRRVVDGVTGLALTGFGVRLALARQ